jgi:ABC-2 type transport system ATP-binding protein
MAERIGVISQGKLIAEGTLDELRGKAGSKVGDTSLEDVFLTLVGSTQRRHDDRVE